MTNSVPPPEDSLPADVQRQINAICLQFEQACQAGPPWPHLEGYLAGTEEPLRSALLSELLALELYYRQAAGEVVDLADYQQRFPGHDETLQAAVPTDRSNASTPPGASSLGEVEENALLTTLDAETVPCEP